MSILNSWGQHSQQCVEHIFELSQSQTHQRETVIIGGGISGILTALRLSRVPGKLERGITLLESAPTLGGRLFFSAPQNAQALSRSEMFLKRLEHCRTGKAGGFGFESLGNEAAQSIERHLRSALSDEELQFVDLFISEAQTETDNESRTTFFVKKGLIPFSEAIGNSSELLTRKEAEILSGLLRDTPQEYASVESKLSWQEAPTWKTLTNAQKDSLQPFLETLVAKGILEYNEHTAKKHLDEFSRAINNPTHASFRRTSGFELACELILRSRGIEVLTSTKLVRLVSPQNHSFELTATNAAERKELQITASSVVIAAPLISCIPFLPREFLSGNQAKNILRNPPSSLVVAEYADFGTFREPEVCAPLKPGDKVLFTTERIQGTINRAGSLLLFSFLNYEESLQAESVRETVGRIRRAANRVLVADALKSTAGRTLVHMNTGIKERLVLMPVARQFENPAVPLREVRMGVKGLYSCGDNFSFDIAPWKNIVQSVHDVISILSKES
ncbi:MAG: FAD-dependent oxidoreductase [Burkholderiales bacterium]|nr:MAG: FAD-dependent oxidoreductase [Burkholderiales bacterium]